MFRLMIIFITLLISVNLKGYAFELDDTLSRSQNSIAYIPVISKAEYDQIIQKGLGVALWTNFEEGLIEIANGFQKAYQDNKGERALGYVDMEIYVLLQMIKNGKLEPVDKSFLINFFGAYFSEQLETDRIFNNNRHLEEMKPLFLRIKLLCSVLNREEEFVHEYLEKYLSAEPENHAVHILKAYLQFEEGNWLDAIECCSEAIDISPEYATGYLLRGLSYGYSGMNLEAINDLQKSIELFPQNPTAFAQLGILYYQAENYPDAASCYRKALEINPGYVWIYNNLGNCYRKMEQPDSALYYFDSAVYYQPDVPYIYMNIGDVHFELEEYEVARYIYSKALDLDSTDHIILYMIGNTCYELKNYQEGIRYMKKAVEIEPSHGPSLTNLGWFYYLTGDFQKCLECSRRAYAIDTSDYYAKYNAALAVLRMGRIEEAYEMYHTFYQEKTDFDITGAVIDLNELIGQGIMAREARYILKNILNVR